MSTAPKKTTAEREDAAVRLRRLRMRAWRRGTREMDLILGPFADTALAGLSAGDLDVFEALLDENDHDLYRQISTRLTQTDGGRAVAGATPEAGQPAAQAVLLDTIARHASSRLRPDGQG